MKANELMIGDYVSVKPSGMLIKIAAVYHEKVAYHTVDHKLSWVRESLLEPIPLTQEILEKNGFEKDKYGQMVLDEELGTSEIYIVLQDDDECYWWDVNNERIAKIRYVHQLQHALRLSGTEKEIEL